MSILVAGIGNIFLGDDGFGVEVVRQLAGHTFAGDVQTVDYGIRGIHLAYDILDHPYELVVMLDAVSRGGAPGTLYLIEPDELGEAPPGDAHGMHPQAVLATVRQFGPPPRVLVLGCEAASVDEGIGLSEPVAAAVAGAIQLLVELLERERPDQVNRSRPRHEAE